MQNQYQYQKQMMCQNLNQSYQANYRPYPFSKKHQDYIKTQQYCNRNTVPIDQKLFTDIQGNNYLNNNKIKTQKCLRKQQSSFINQEQQDSDQFQFLQKFTELKSENLFQAIQTKQKLVVKKRLSYILGLFQKIVLKNIGKLKNDAKPIQYKYQQIYEQIYDIVNEEKLYTIQEFEQKYQFQNYKDLILYNIFQVSFPLRLIPQLHFVINGFNQLGSGNSQQISKIDPNDSTCDMEQSIGKIGLYLQIFRKLALNIEQVGSLLLFLQNIIDENLISSQNSIPSQKWIDQQKIEKLQWNWRQKFSIKRKIYCLVMEGILCANLTQNQPNRIIITQQDALSIHQQVGVTFRYAENHLLSFLTRQVLELHKQFSQKYLAHKLPCQISSTDSSSIKSRNVSELKQGLIEILTVLLQLSSKSFYYQQKQNKALNILQLFKKVFVKSQFTQHLNSIYSRMVAHQLKVTNQRIQQLSQQKKINRQKIAQIFLQMINSFKHLLQFVKKSFRQLFLDPHLSYFSKKNHNQSNLSYLNQLHQHQRVLIKKDINKIIQILFLECIFTQSNIDFTLNQIMRKNQIILLRNTFCDEDQQQKQIQIERLLFSFFIGQPEYQKDKCYQGLNIFENYKFQHLKFEKKQHICGKLIKTEQDIIIALFKKFIQRAVYFVKCYKQILVYKVGHSFNRRFEQTSNFQIQSNLVESNNILESFVSQWLRFNKLIRRCLQSCGILSCVLKVTFLIVSSLTSAFEQAIQNPTVQFPLRVILYYQGLIKNNWQSNLCGEHQSKIQMEKDNFIQLFRIGSRSEGFLRVFQDHLYRLTIATSLTRVNQQIIRHLDMYNIDQNSTNTFSHQYLYTQLNYQLNQQIMGFIIQMQGIDYVKRIQQARFAIQNKHLLFSSAFKLGQTQKNKRISQKSKIKIIKTKQSKLRKNVIANARSNSLEIMSVIVLNQSNFFKQTLNNQSKKLKLPIIYKNSFLEVRNKLNSGQQFILDKFIHIKIDPIFKQYIDCYESQLQKKLGQQNFEGQIKNLKWLISYRNQSNVLMELKIPVRNISPSIVTNSLSVYFSKQTDKIINTRSFMTENNRKNTYSSSKQCQIKKFLFRMPLMMFDLVIYALRIRLQKSTKSQFTLSDYILNIYDYNKWGKDKFQQLIQKVVKNAKKLTKIGFLQMVQSNQNTDVLKQIDLLRINQMFVTWQNQKQNSLLQKLFTNCQNKQIYSNSTLKNIHSKYFKANKLLFLDFVYINHVQYCQGYLGNDDEKDNSHKELQLVQVQRQLSNPSSQFLSSLEYFLVRFFKRQKVIYSDKITRNFFQFILQYQKNKGFGKILFFKTVNFITKSHSINQKQINQQVEQSIAGNDKKLDYNLFKLQIDKLKQVKLSFQALINCLVQKLVKKQYLEKKIITKKTQHQSAETQNQQKNLNLSLRESQIILFQYLP